MARMLVRTSYLLTSFHFPVNLEFHTQCVSCHFPTLSLESKL